MATLSVGGTTVFDGAVLQSGVTGAGGLRSMQVFNTAGTHTWTKPTGITTIRVFLTGAGGGGGHGNTGQMAGGGGAAGGSAV